MSQRSCYIFLKIVNSAQLSEQEQQWLTYLSEKITLVLTGYKVVRAEMLDQQAFVENLLANDHDFFVMLSVLTMPKDGQPWADAMLETLPYHKDNLLVVNILKQPLAAALIPSVLLNFKTYALFLYDHTFNHVIDDMKELFERKKYDFLLLVFEIAEYIEAKFKDNQQRPFVFLAPTTARLTPFYTSLRREIFDHGYDILPLSPYPKDLNQAQKRFEQEIVNAEMIIHLFDGRQEQNNMDTNASFYFYNQQAVRFLEKNDKHLLNRIIWIAPPTSTDDLSAYNQAYESIQRDADVMTNALVVQTGLEDLKSIVFRSLKEHSLSFTKNSENPQDHKTADEHLPCLYILHKIDQENFANSIKSSILAHKDLFFVLSPTTQDVKQRRSINKKHIKNADCLLIVMENNDLRWLRSQLNEIFKNLAGQQNEDKKVFLWTQQPFEKPNDFIFSTIDQIFYGKEAFADLANTIKQSVSNEEKTTDLAKND